MATFLKRASLFFLYHYLFSLFERRVPFHPLLSNFLFSSCIIFTVRCVFGTQINNTTGTCEACGEGTFKPENSSRIRCRPCPEGLIPNRKTGATKCIGMSSTIQCKYSNYINVTIL